ncbi:MAG: caspase family protein [Deltaproteobacteria bacterium]|nr:caspase family protein [Deltaproteobacteria bacterium]
MQAMSIRIFLILFILFLIRPYALQAATEQRSALVIGNSAYSSGPLKNPVNDAADMAAMLKKLGFSVTLKKNASLQEMEEAIESFGNRLKRGGVGLFYYAGHGVQVNGVNYLLPIGAKINKEADVKYQAVDANKILDEMATANNGLNIVMLDACRDNPFARSFRNATRGLAIVSSAPSGTFISYSTSPGNVARDGDGRNSPYTAALLKYMQAPGLTISDVFINVRAKVKKETGQVPWELSSLEGQFYFMPGSEKRITDVSPSGKSLTDKYESNISVTDELDDESRKLEDEERKLEKEKVLLEKKKALKEKRQKIDEEKASLEAKKSTTLAMAKRPSQPTAGETARDGRFIAYDNGTVLDTRTNQMWAARDNGSGINWQDAKNYCENYRGGGYTDWRMPALDELAGLYDAGKTYKSGCGYDVHLTELIRLTCVAPWASETRGSVAAQFDFNGGGRYWFPPGTGPIYRALPVRSGK